MHWFKIIGRPFTPRRTFRQTTWRKQPSGRSRRFRSLTAETLERRNLFAGLTEIPELHSNPLATAKVYLDFNGYFEADWWGGTDDGNPNNDVVRQLADDNGNLVNVTVDENDSFQGIFDMDGDITSFNDAELAMITSIWRLVADDFSPFNIDVTTAPAGDLSDGNGILAAIRFANAGGVAQLNAWTNAGLSNSVYASGTTASAAACVVSQEVGHAFGLDHQLQFTLGAHRPIMFGICNTGRNTWWMGVDETRSFQNDLIEIASPANGLGFRADDHAQDFNGATALGTIAASSRRTIDGVIEQPMDADAFSLTATEPARVRVRVVENLDPDVELYDVSGNLIDSAGAARGYELRIPSAGQFFVRIQAHTPTSDELANGYLTFGNVGQYQLEVGDHVGPYIRSAEWASQTIRLHFSEPLDANSFDVSDIAEFTDLQGVDHRSAIQGVLPAPTSDRRIWEIRLDRFPVGGFRLVIGPRITDAHGNWMDQDRDGTQGEPFDDQYRVHQALDVNPPTLLSAVLALPGPIGPRGFVPRGTNLLVAFDESMDAATFDPSDVVINGPNGPVTVNGVSVFNGVGFNHHPGFHSRNFLVSLNARDWGSYSGKIGPDVSDLFGNTMDNNGNGLGGETTDAHGWKFRVQPTLLDRSRGFAEDVAAKYELFPKRWVPPIDPDPAFDGEDFSMAKTLMVHTAIDVGVPGPDATFGWGLEDPAGAIELLDSVFSDDPNVTLVEDTYAGQTMRWEVHSDGGGELRATLGWLDPGGAKDQLDHDLDLWIVGPSGDVHRPWVLGEDGNSKTGANHRDDLEQVLVATPAKGIYTVYVSSSKPIKSQSFSLLIDAAADAQPALLDASWETFVMTLETKHQGDCPVAECGAATASSTADPSLEAPLAATLSASVKTPEDKEFTPPSPFDEVYQNIDELLFSLLMQGDLLRTGLDSPR